MNIDILNRTEKLTDEKYDWLEKQEKEKKAIGEKFDIDRDTDVWYTMKIAELQLLQEMIIDKLKTKH